MITNLAKKKQFYFRLGKILKKKTLYENFKMVEVLTHIDDLKGSNAIIPCDK